MARRCDITEKGVLTGNNVSHSNRKSRRRFLPNIQTVSLLSDTLGKSFKMDIATATLRSIDHNGGLDNFLLKTSNTKLSSQAVKIKKQIKKAQEAKDVKKSA